MYEGEVLSHVLAANVSSGGVVVLPAGIAIAAVDGVIGDSISVAVEGVFSLPKKPLP